MNFVFSRTTKQFAALIFVAFSVSCGSFTRTVPQSDQSVSSSNQSISSTSDSSDKSDLLNSEEGMQKFVTDLKKAVGSENPNILTIAIYDSYASIQVQDPNKPENVDSYMFRDNKLAPPNPVKLIGGGDLKDNVFPLNDVDLSKISALSKEVGEKLKDIEGGKLVGYSIERELPFSKELRIAVLTSATRKNVSAQADANGKLTEFKVK